MDVLHIFRCTKQGSNANVVFIVSVAHQHTSRLHVVCRQCTLQVGNRESCYGHLFLVGHYLQDASRHPGNVRHRHFGQLLNAPFHHIFRQLAQRQEALFVRLFKGPVLFQGHVQVQHRDIRRTGLDGLGAFRFFRQAVHGSINLLVHFDECQVGIHPKVELHADDARSVSCLTLYLTQPRHLQQLSAHRCHHRILQLTRRGVLARHLHRNLRDGNVRQKRNRQRIVRHQSHDEAGSKRHQHRNRSL